MHLKAKVHFSTGLKNPNNISLFPLSFILEMCLPSHLNLCKNILWLAFKNRKAEIFVQNYFGKEKEKKHIAAHLKTSFYNVFVD